MSNKYSKAIKILLSTLNETETQCYVTNDWEDIVNYLADCERLDIIKQFDNRKENSGVALIYNDTMLRDHLLLITRTRDMKSNNGLSCIIALNVATNTEGVKIMRQLARKQFSDNPELREKILSNIDSFVNMAINQNV